MMIRLSVRLSQFLVAEGAYCSMLFDRRFNSEDIVDETLGRISCCLRNIRYSVMNNP